MTEPAPGWLALCPLVSRRSLHQVVQLARLRGALLCQNTASSRLGIWSNLSVCAPLSAPMTTWRYWRLSGCWMVIRLKSGSLTGSWFISRLGLRANSTPRSRGPRRSVQKRDSEGPSPYGKMRFGGAVRHLRGAIERPVCNCRQVQCPQPSRLFHVARQRIDNAGHVGKMDHPGHKCRDYLPYARFHWRHYCGRRRECDLAAIERMLVSCGGIRFQAP